MFGIGISLIYILEFLSEFNVSRKVQPRNTKRHLFLEKGKTFTVMQPL